MQKTPIIFEKNDPSRTTLEKHPRNSRENHYGCYDKIQIPRVLRGFVLAHGPRIAWKKPKSQSGKMTAEKRDNSRENDRQHFLSSRKTRKTSKEAGGKNSPNAINTVKNEVSQITKRNENRKLRPSTFEAM
jgi:hypothetical protein